MKTRCACLLLVAGAIPLGATPVFAQNASAKATAAINTAVGCTSTGAITVVDPATGISTVSLDCHDVFTGTPVAGDPSTNFVPVMTASVKVSNSQSLFVSPSLVTGLYTQTKTSSKPGTTSTAVAAGGVYLRAVLKDGAGNIVQTAEPILSGCVNSNTFGCGGVGGGVGVTLDARVQSLTQSITDCIVSTGGTCDFTLSTDLILQTSSAHTFNFIFLNVGTGTYKVSIEAAVNASAFATANTGSSAVGAAAFGLGSLTVESVRLVHDFSF